MEKISCSKFNELPWHDACIENIYIDRRCPGVRDDIYMDIVWTDDKKNKIKFSDVYNADLRLNFGVVALESIRYAQCKLDECEEIVILKNKWRGLINNIKLNYYEIETNSTNSKIIIIARELYIDKAH